MAFYSVVKKKNLQKPEEAPKYYAVQRSIGTLSEDDFVERVSRHTGVSRGIVKAVLTDIIDEVLDNIALGYNVRLGELGIFSIGVKTATPTASEADFSEANIECATLRLRLTKIFEARIKSSIKMRPFTTVTGKTEVIETPEVALSNVEEENNIIEE